MARKPQADNRPLQRAPTRDRIRDGQQTGRESARAGIPQPSDADFEDVHWALSAASTLWDRGEDTEALKWLRRAASAAAERDADARAVELFKAAAEVASDLEARRRAKQAQPVPDSSPPPPAEEMPVPLVVAKFPPRPATSPPRPGATRAPAARASEPSTATPVQRASAASEARKTQPTPKKPAPPRAGRYGTDSTIVPPVPPEPSVIESPRPLGLRFDESEEETFVRPETLVRRALMAIDPDYARRTDYSDWEESSSDDGPDESTPSRGDSWETGGRASCGDSWETGERASRGDSWESGGRGSQAESAAPSTDRDRDAKTQRRAEAALDSAAAPNRSRAPSGGQQAGPVPGALPALRVAVLYIPEERDVRLVFLPPDAEPPEGVAVALLVPLSEIDAQRLAQVYADCDSKL
jgi:hypothetical protein